MHKLAQQIVERVVAGGRSAQDALLQSLLEATAAGSGELQRLSARRLVMKLKIDGRTWLFKIDSPQRSFESLRGRLRQPSLLREAEHLRQLGLNYPALPAEVHAEQLDAANGLFARPWLEGRCGDVWVPQDAEAVGVGLAKLHELGWTDADLCPADLLLDAAGCLLPLDLGHAFLHENGPSPEKVRLRDLVRLLGGWNEAQRLELGEAIVAAYAGLLPCPAGDEILRQAKLWRFEIMRRQSRRCLRRTRDFLPTAHGGERVEAVPVGAALRLPVHDLRAAKRAFRLLYELELLELPALRVLRFGTSQQHAFVEVAAPPHTLASAGEETAVHACLAALHDAGFAVFPHQLQDFHIQANGTAVLANAASLQRHGS